MLINYNISIKDYFKNYKIIYIIKNKSRIILLKYYST